MPLFIGSCDTKRQLPHRPHNILNNPYPYSLQVLLFVEAVNETLCEGESANAELPAKLGKPFLMVVSYMTIVLDIFERLRFFKHHISEKEYVS
jgi:hypothetical protein